VVVVGGGRRRRQVFQRFDRGKLFFNLFFDMFIDCGFGFSLSLGFVVNEKICLAMALSWW